MTCDIGSDAMRRKRDMLRYPPGDKLHDPLRTRSPDRKRDACRLAPAPRLPGALAGPAPIAMIANAI
jgi:hypothetical protein